MKEENQEVNCEYCKDGDCWLNVPDSLLKCKYFGTNNPDLPCIKTTYLL